LYLATIAGHNYHPDPGCQYLFADFPRLSAMMGKDGFLPRQFAFRGSRLVFSYGIVALAVVASS